MMSIQSKTRQMMVLGLSFIICHLSFSPAGAQNFVGGDLSMLARYEAQHATYYDKDGKAVSDVLAFVKAQGWNTIRVRLFADPSASADKAVCQDLEYVKALGRRIKEAGLRFMLDFHYSDTWADPSQQATPKMFLTFNTPTWEYIYTYTKETLEALVKAGATPDLIQTGNEISFGMLWDGGCQVTANDAWNAYLDTNWDALATALRNAGKACREVCPQARIIIHTEQCANNPTLDVAFFNRVKAYAIDYDIIGVSYYPYFKGELAKLDKGLSALEQAFPDKHIQLVETGYPSKWEVQGTTYNYTATYPYSHEGQRRYTADLITMLKKHQQVNGLSWWYAEANAKGCTGNLASGWYNAGLFDNETGKALPALYELQSFAGGESGIHASEADRRDSDDWHDMAGRKFNKKPATKGLYIQSGRKIAVR